jgi:hypothetical protein
MRRIAWISFAYLLLFLSPGSVLRAGVLTQAAPPTTPAGFGGVAQSTTSIQWSWGASTGSTFITYDIHATPETSPPTIIASGLSATTYLETGLSENTKYTRHVHAVGTFGDMSPPSNSQSRYTLVHTATTADFSVAATSPTATRVTVVPPPNPAADFTGVEIFRNVPNAVTISPFSPVYAKDDTGLQPKTQYCYNIQFRNGDSIPSGPSPSSLCATTPDNEPGLCRWDVKIVTMYRTPDNNVRTPHLADYVDSEGTTVFRNAEFGFNEGSLTQKGVRIFGTMRQKRADDSHLIVTHPAPDEMEDLDGINSQTTMIVTHSGVCKDGQPKGDWKGSAEYELDSGGRRGFCLVGFCPHWAQGSGALLEGQDLLKYKFPHGPVFATTTDGDKGMIIFVGGELLGELGFAGTDLTVLFPSRQKDHKQKGFSIFGNHTGDEYKFTWLTTTDVAGKIDPGSSSVGGHGKAKGTHTFDFKASCSDCRVKVDFKDDGQKAHVKIQDDTQDVNYTLVAPDANKTADASSPQFKGGGGPWKPGE